MCTVSFLQFPSSFGRSFEGKTQYLERGRQGVAACPALLGAGLIPSEVPVIYWYLGPITRGKQKNIVATFLLLLVYFYFIFFYQLLYCCAVALYVTFRKI